MVSQINLGPIVECNNCGTKGKWTDELADGKHIRILPRNWSHIPNTYSGTVYFCSPKCEQKWISVRERSGMGIRPPLPEVVIKQMPEPEPSVTPLIDEIDGKEMCVCGMGPFTKRGLGGHMRSHEHADRMQAGEAVER